MRIVIILFSFLISTGAVYSQNARVVGYLPTYRFALSNKIEYCKLTHLNLSFANPDSNGNLLISSLSSVMSDALKANPEIIIMVSVGGGALSTQQASNWSNLIDIPTNRPAFISKIVNFLLVNKLHGIDIDLEGSHITSGYSDFVFELNTALDVHGKFITAALPNQSLSAKINQKALSVFDFINIMSYDATGPWRPSSPGQHSSYSFAQNGINFWTNNVGINGKRLNLGLPFYGYDFVNSTTVNSFTFGQMVSSSLSYADIDNVGNKFYNGRPTIESKVELANNKVGGVLIWEVGQDSFDQYSLLTAIHKKYTSLGITTTNKCGNSIVSLNESEQRQDQIEVYPNPSTSYLTIKNYNSLQNYRILSIIGEKLFEADIPDSKIIDISYLSNGMYFLQFNNGKTIKFVKSDV